MAFAASLRRVLVVLSVMWGAFSLLLAWDEFPRESSIARALAREAQARVEGAQLNGYVNTFLFWPRPFDEQEEDARLAVRDAYEAVRRQRAQVAAGLAAEQAALARLEDDPQRYAGDWQDAVARVATRSDVLSVARAQEETRALALDHALRSLDGTLAYEHGLIAGLDEAIEDARSRREALPLARAAWAAKVAAFWSAPTALMLLLLALAGRTYRSLRRSGLRFRIGV